MAEMIDQLQEEIKHLKAELAKSKRHRNSMSSIPIPVQSRLEIVEAEKIDLEKSVQDLNEGIDAVSAKNEALE
jgi:prefoldin subunit 5